MLCDSFSEVLEVRLQGAVVDDTDTDLEFEMLDGAGEYYHTQDLHSVFSSRAAGRQVRQPEQRCELDL